MNSNSIQTRRSLSGIRLQRPSYESLDDEGEKGIEVEHSDELVSWFQQRNLGLEYIESSNNSLISRCFHLDTSIPLPREIRPFLNIAVKEILHPIDCGHRKQCQDLRNELNHLTKLRHPHIIMACYDQIFENIGGCTIFLPAAKRDLFDMIHKPFVRPIDKICKNVQLVRRCIFEVGSALSYMHLAKQLVHNDVKSENVLIFEGKHFKLTDFGFCRKPKSYICYEEFFNMYKHRNFQYIPPEFSDYFADRTLPPNLINEYSADVFGLGVILFQLIFSMNPFSESQQFYCVPRKVADQLVANSNMETEQIIRNNQPPPPPFNPNGRRDSVSIELEPQMAPKSVSASHFEEDIWVSQTRVYFHDQDPIYKNLYNQRDIHRFWQHFEPQFRHFLHSGLMSEIEIGYFKDLMIRTITPHSSLRINLFDFMNHPWLSLRKNKDETYKIASGISTVRIKTKPASQSSLQCNPYNMNSNQTQK